MEIFHMFKQRMESYHLVMTTATNKDLPPEGPFQIIATKMKRLCETPIIVVTCVILLLSAAAVAIFFFNKSGVLAEEEWSLGANSFSCLRGEGTQVGGDGGSPDVNCIRVGRYCIVLAQKWVEQREIELNKTFSSLIEGLNLQIQQLEAERTVADATGMASTVDLPAEIFEKLRSEPTDESGCHSYGDEMMHEKWFQWEMGLGYKRFSREATIACFNSLPNKLVVFFGDSILRGVFTVLLRKLNAPDDHFKDIDYRKEHLEQNHFHTEGDVKLHFIFAGEPDKLMWQVQRFPEIMSAGIMFMGTGSWTLAADDAPNTLFMMTYIARLSALIEFLQLNFKGRVIFLMTPPVARALLLQRGNPRSRRWNSKIQALNRFAEKLVTGAGYEILNTYDFLSTGEGGFIPYKNLTTDGFHPNDKINDIILDVYTNEICRGTPFDYTTPGKLANVTKAFNGTHCQF